MANSNARAGASGVLRRCSQSRKVVMGRWKASANSAWVIPRRCRRTLTRDTRRILASCSGLRGCASGSDKAAVMTSSSVRASSRAQSVSPRGGGSPGFTVTRVVAVLLMSCGLPGGYDSTDVLAAQRHNHEQDIAMSHSDSLNPLFAVNEPCVDLFDTVRSSRAAMASAKSTPCLRRLSAALLLFHSYCKRRIVPDIGSTRKQPAAARVNPAN